MARAGGVTQRAIRRLNKRNSTGAAAIVDFDIMAITGAAIGLVTSRLSPTRATGESAAGLLRREACNAITPPAAAAIAASSQKAKLMR